MTAQKREERLQDVPIPLSVISTSSLAANYQVKLTDFYSAVPGLSITPMSQKRFSFLVYVQHQNMHWRSAALGPAEE